MHRTDLFILSGVDVEYTKTNTFKFFWWMMLYILKYIFEK